MKTIKLNWIKLSILHNKQEANGESGPLLSLQKGILAVVKVTIALEVATY